jgi:O-antigen/teichoic acid export membrane protein
MMDSNIEDNIEITPEVTLEQVKKRALNGVVALTGRTLFLQLISFGAGFLLTIFLVPEQFGTWIAVQAFLGIFSIFQDIGLAAALIQKKETPSRKTLETTFTVQNALVICIVLVIFLTTPIYSRLAHFDQQSIYLAWALAGNFLFSSLMSIPSILLERKLDFSKLIIPGIVGQILYQLVVVFLAWKGFGVTSFTVAVLVSGFSSLILMYIISPWRPGLAFDRDSLKDLLHFGLPYQINQILAKLKDDGVIVFLAIILGPANIGLLGWAMKWPKQLLNLVMDPVTRVTFPAFSRMQSHPEELSMAVSKSIFFICLFVFPALVLLTCIAPSLVILIPKYLKWQPALFALGLLSINAAWAAVSTPLTNVLNATGRIKITFYLMIMWTGLTWILLPVLSDRFGLNGAAAGFALVGMSSIVAIVIAARIVKINLLESVGKPLLGTAIMLVILLAGRQFVPISWVGIILLSILSFIIYSGVMFILVGPSLIEDAKKFALNIRAKSE